MSILSIAQGAVTQIIPAEWANAPWFLEFYSSVKKPSWTKGCFLDLIGGFYVPKKPETKSWAPVQYTTYKKGKQEKQSNKQTLKTGQVKKDLKQKKTHHFLDVNLKNILEVQQNKTNKQTNQKENKQTN